MALSERAELAVREIDDLIDTNYAPDKMYPQEALEFLERIASNIECKIDALKPNHALGKQVILVIVLAVLFVIAGSGLSYLMSLVAGPVSRHPVHASESQRFEPISTSEWMTGYRFTVFHDKVSGTEFICAMNDVHFNPTCFPSGRSWK